MIAQGAEAMLRREGDALVKERIKKGYRIAEIDERLRKKRTKSEANILRAARRIINVPQVIAEGNYEIKMEFIGGELVKEVLNENNCIEISEKIAIAVARLHSYDIVHGDLTTSNMILKKNDLYFIDFGLAFFSKRTEDKAIDLHLLHEALESTHFAVLDDAWKTILKVYSEEYSEAGKVIKTLSEIEKRGRYRER
ncbi:MAG: KEOPS complex kinase/ATPase Bud32 [Candidatus Aenigmatarchaeota archaeon]